MEGAGEGNMTERPIGRGAARMMGGGGVGDLLPYSYASQGQEQLGAATSPSPTFPDPPHTTALGTPGLFGCHHLRRCCHNLHDPTG